MDGDKSRNFQKTFANMRKKGYYEKKNHQSDADSFRVFGGHFLKKATNPSPFLSNNPKLWLSFIQIIGAAEVLLSLASYMKQGQSWTGEQTILMSVWFFYLALIWLLVQRFLDVVETSAQAPSLKKHLHIFLLYMPHVPFSIYLIFCMSTLNAGKMALVEALFLFAKITIFYYVVRMAFDK